MAAITKDIGRDDNYFVVDAALGSASEDDPATQYRIQIDSEVMLVRRGGTGLKVVRGASGTTPAVHFAGATVSLVSAAAAQIGVGDGITDDTAALQAAINAGGDVVLKPGKYRLTSPLTVSSPNFSLGGPANAHGQWPKVAAGAVTIIAPSGQPAFIFNSGGASTKFSGPRLHDLAIAPPFTTLRNAQLGNVATLAVQDTSLLDASGTVLVLDGPNLARITYTGKTSNTLTGCTLVSESNAGVTYANACVVCNPCPYGVKIQRANNFGLRDVTFHSFCDLTAVPAMGDASTAPGACGLIIDGTQNVAQYGTIEECRFYGCVIGVYEAVGSTRYHLCDFDASQNNGTPLAGSTGYMGRSIDTACLNQSNFHGCDNAIDISGANGTSILGCRFETWKTTAVKLVNAKRITFIPTSMNNFQAGNIGTGVTLDAASTNCLIDLSKAVSLATRFTDAGSNNRILDTGLEWLSGVLRMVGSGTPEGVVTAPVGSTFHRTNGGAATSLYVKESGAGNTGWVAK